jgi:hypothetical protein
MLQIHLNWVADQLLLRHFLKPSACLYFSQARRMAPLMMRKLTRCRGDSPRSRCGLTGGQWRTWRQFYFPANARCLRTHQMAMRPPKHNKRSGEHASCFLHVQVSFHFPLHLTSLWFHYRIWYNNLFTVQARKPWW